MNYKVSVIVPVYNVEKYLRKCLNSLINQTLKELQIIIVNDGSPDNSQNIIDEFANKYTNVIALVKENGGLSDARNFGLTYATGEYIGFIDSDDYVDATMYQTMYEQAKNDDSDLVVCDLVYTYQDNGLPDMLMHGLNGEIENRHKAGFLSPLFAWNKIYKSSFFRQHDFKFPINLWYEDIPVTIPCFVEANKISYVNQPMVYYLQRSTSIMGSDYNPKMFDIFTELESVYSYLQANNKLDMYYQEIEYLYIEHLLYYGGFRFLRTPNFIELCDHARATVDVKFPNWRKNIYLQKISLKNRIFILTNNALTYRLWKLIIGGK